MLYYMKSNINCTPHKFYLNFGTNIVVHIIFLFTILAFLFMLVISKISSDAINNELSELVNQNIDKQLDKLTPEQKKFIKEKIKYTGLDKLSELYSVEDKTRKINNYFVYSTVKITMILLLVIFIVIVAVSRLLCHKLPLRSILVENLIIFTGVGIVEFAFFKYIILKYIPVEPSFMTKHLLKTIKKQFT